MKNVVFKRSLGRALAALILVLIVTTVQAQPGGGCDPIDPACPIDGGLSLLIAAGIGLGAKKAYNERKKQQAAE